MYHKKTKHLEVNFHVICEEVDSQEIITPYVMLKVQNKNMFAKALGTAHLVMLSQAGLLLYTYTA